MEGSIVIFARGREHCKSVGYINQFEKLEEHCKLDDKLRGKYSFS
jgi:hypothetical protein